VKLDRHRQVENPVYIRKGESMSFAHETRADQACYNCHSLLPELNCMCILTAAYVIDMS
jgi:hypothetical protein